MYRKFATQIVWQMYFVNPSDLERFSLRHILLYRPGCKSFEELRTVNPEKLLQGVSMRNYTLRVVTC